MSERLRQRMVNKLTQLYGAENVSTIWSDLHNIFGTQAKHPKRTALEVTQKDVVLITYGDMMHFEDDIPLKVQHKFLKETISEFINSVHILPFYPYSSDDGFSVIDYYAVHPEMGDWQHIEAFGQDFRLMFDAVFNHISAQSDWFQKFLRGEEPYKDYFVTVDPHTDLSAVVRPRALPLLTPFETAEGIKHLWTTFSDDQIDLNAANPAVLLDLIKILLFYVHKGAKLIRLDAIAFLWKKVGTSSIHLEETHLIIQLLRDALDWVAPETILITETNVPHKENISYFGDGNNEAQMVYQFPLPPLILHTLTTGDATALTQWASDLEPAGEATTFFNFTASHDGIGLRPVTSLLSDREVERLVKVVQEHGGYVSYRAQSDGSQSPYELNITYFDAITHPDVTSQDPQLAVQALYGFTGNHAFVGWCPWYLFSQLVRFA